MRKKKISIIGHFANGKVFLDGQTVKTKTIFNELLKSEKIENVYDIDTFNWNNKKVSLLKQILLSSIYSKNIVLISSKNGIKIFIPLLYFVKKITNVNIHYFVLGAWLPDFIKSKPILKFFMKRMDAIYLETNKMQKDLISIGFNNLHYLPNFKNIKTLDIKDIKKIIPKEKINLCTFSRVMKEKGIEDAIYAVKKINKESNKTIFYLDIYGPIDENYKEEFEKIKLKFPDYINYKGTVDYNSSVEVIKNYDLLLFPTLFKTEGIPGTIIDAYSSGVPVIASDWESSREVIKNHETGIIYDFGNVDQLVNVLKNINNNNFDLYQFKINCLKEAKKFSGEIFEKNFIQKIYGD